MATFEIQRAGKTFEIEAPDMDSAIKALNSYTPHKSRDFSAPQLGNTQRVQELRKEADFREKMGAGGFNSRFADTISLGAFNPAAAALSAAGSTAGNILSGRMPTPVEDYKRERDVQDELLRRAREKASPLDTAVEIGASLPFYASQAPSVALQAPSLIKQGVDAAKTGAIFGGIYGLNSARGDLGDQLSGAVGGAAAGAALGPALHYGVSAAAAVPRTVSAGLRAVTGRTPAGVAENAARAAEFQAAGVTPFGPEIGGDTSRTLGRSLARSDVSGAPIRAQAAATIGDIERNAQRLLARETGGVPGNDLGIEAQQTLRRNLIGRTRSEEELAGLSQAERSAIARGETADSYPTQFSAGYQNVNLQTPSFQRNPLGRKNETPSEFTATRQLLDDLGMEARRNLQNPGYKPGRPFGDSDNEPIQAPLRSWLDRKFGPEIAQRLEQFSIIRARGSIGTPGPQGLRDLITLVGRAKREALRPPYPGQPRDEQGAALTRLESALKDDYHRFLTETGPHGAELSANVRAIDTAYRTHLEDVRRPLERLYGPNVQPIDAMNRLVTAAERGDLSLLRPYMRVMAEKNNPTRAAAAVISHMTNNARTLDDFIAGYGRIPAQSRNVLFGSNQFAQDLRRNLDQLEALGRRMQPYQQAIQRAQQYGGNIRAGHIPLGAMLYYQFVPTMVAIAGQSAVARFMASPRYVNWLTTAARARSPQALTQQISRLGFLIDAGGKTTGRPIWQDSEEAKAVKGAAASAAKQAIEAFKTGVIPPAYGATSDPSMPESPRTNEGGMPAASNPMADAIEKAARSRGIDPATADPQAVLDAAWEADPSDGMAEAIDFVSKRYGLKTPWGR